MYFRYFLITSPWKRTNLNPLHPWMLCAKFGWNLPSGTGEEDENVKIYDNANNDDDDGDNDNDWQRTNFDQKSLLEPLAQVS